VFNRQRVADEVPACYRNAMSLDLPSAGVGLSFAALLFVSGACGAVPAEPEVRSEAGSPDTGVVDAPGGNVNVSILDSSFTACRCHHGFGPGINGTAQIHVVSSETRSVTLVPGTFVLKDQTSGTAYTTTQAGDSHYSVFNVPGSEGNPPTAPSFQPVLAAGASTDISVTFYIDGVPSLPIPASPYVLLVDLGGGVTATSSPFALDEVLDAATP
jgi:hypothetical protein